MTAAFRSAFGDRKLAIAARARRDLAAFQAAGFDGELFGSVPGKNGR